MNTIRAPGRTITVGDAVRRLNPHAFAKLEPEAKILLNAAPIDKAANRIRQSSKPVLNELESEALAWLMEIYPSASFHRQAWRVKIANGAWYKVDLCSAMDGLRWHAWEVKELRGKNVDRGKLALKCAAYQFPEVRWHLLWREKGGPWQEQEIFP